MGGAKEPLLFNLIYLNTLCSLSLLFLHQVHNELVRLDEQELNNKYKIGVLYCRKGQTSEEEMYNNGEITLTLTN